MKFLAFLLQFKGPVHISRRAADSLIHPDVSVRSDTLSAALASALAMGGTWGSDARETAAGIRAFLEELAISSAFPYIREVKKNGESDFHYFLPRPAGSVLSGDATLRKKEKKVVWLSRPLFEQIIRGENVEGRLKMVKTAAGGANESEEVLDGVSRLITAQDRIRVKIDRLGGGGEKGTTPYPVTAIWFSKDEREGVTYESGLYFLVPATLPRRVLELIQSGLNILSDLGIGSDRSVGFGVFEWEKEEVSIETPAGDEGAAWLNLGLFVPRKEDFSGLSPEAYQLVLRSGWVTSLDFLNVRRRSVYMFEEGGLFRSPHFPAGDSWAAIGRVLDLTPRKIHHCREYAIEGMHPIYRSGRTIFIPTKL